MVSLHARDAAKRRVANKKENVEVFTVADVDDEDHVNNSFLQVWKLGFVHTPKHLI